MVGNGRLGAALAGQPDQRELLAWVTVLALAAILRVAALGNWPLDPDESALALEAWSESGPGRGWASAATTTPALTHVMSVVFFLFTASEGAARSLSAVSGLLTVGGMYLARPALGSWAALGAAALLALSPLHVSASRSVSTGPIVGLATLALVLCAARLAVLGPAEGRRWAYLAGAAVALGLGTDTAFVLTLLVLGGALLFAFELNPVRGALQAGLTGFGRPALIGLVVVTLLLDTRLFTNPSGLHTAMVDSWWRWAAELLAPGRAPLLPLVHLITSEPLIVILALAALVPASRGEPFERYLASWFLLGFGASVVAGRPDMRYEAVALLPGALLAGISLARLTRASFLREPASYVMACVAAVPLTAGFLGALAALKNGSLPGNALIAATFVGLVGTLIGGFALAGMRATRGGAILLSLSVVTLVGLGGIGRWDEAHRSDRGRAVPGLFLTEETRVVEQQLSIWRFQSEAPYAIEDRLRPVLGWMLRGERQARYEPGERIRGGPAVRLAGPRGDPIPERAERITIGYRALPPVDLAPNRLSEWVLWRRPLVRLEPYDILVLR